jgi:hypothetical protein
VNQTLVLAAVLTLLAVAAAGCGSSKTPSVASLATTTTTGNTTPGAGGTQSTKPSRAALASCFSAHGFQASVGSGDGGGNSLTVFGVTIGGNVDPDSPQFRAAMQACRKFLPGGGPPTLTPAQRAAAANAMLSFASCMRKDGVLRFPDPNGQGRFPFSSISKLDSSAPLFQSAFKACQSLEPKVGPRIEFG